MRSVSDIINSAIAYIAGVQPNVTTLVGSVMRDVVVASPAVEFGTTYTEIDRVSQIQSLTNSSVMTTSELDLLGANFGLTRNQGNQAQATVTFQVSNFQSLESNIVIPSGTVVVTQQTATSTQVAFATTQSGTFIAAQSAVYFNPTTGFFELTLPVQAQNSGTQGNVFAGAINVLSSTIPRIFAVTNTVAATGGSDQESNTDFATRIQTKLAGNNLGTASGIISLALANSNTLEATVVGPNDPEMLRNEFGGSVDLYVRGTSFTSTFDTRTFLLSASRTYILLHQPAVVTSGSITVNGNVGGSPFLFVEGVDYSLVADSSTLVNGSTQVQNGIKFLNTGTHPDDNSLITITYSYDSLIEILQDTFDSSDNHIVGSDILVKEASEALIDVSANISVVSGFNSADTLNNAQTAVTDLITTNKLGVSFNQSDIVAAIENTEGVDQVDLTSLVVKKNTVVVSTQKVTIDKTQYAVANTIILTLI